MKKNRVLKQIEELIKININQIIQDENLIPPSNTIEEIVDESIYKSGNWFFMDKVKEMQQRIMN